MSEDNSVFIGRKPAMNYVLAVVTQFNKGSETVIVKARGKSISRAVDVVEIVRKRFITNLDIVDISIGTETLTLDNKNVNVSSMEITITKTAKEPEPAPEPAPEPVHEPEPAMEPEAPQPADIPDETPE